MTNIPTPEVWAAAQGIRNQAQAGEGIGTVIGTATSQQVTGTKNYMKGGNIIWMVSWCFMSLHISIHVFFFFFFSILFIIIDKLFIVCIQPKIVLLKQ